jgi:hypothetical protein
VYLAERLWKGVLRLAVSVNSSSGRVSRFQRCRCLRASTAVDRKSMGHTVGERWWKIQFLCFSLAIMEGVLRLAVWENSICGRVVRRQRLPVFEGHRLPRPEVDGTYGG